MSGWRGDWHQGEKKELCGLKEQSRGVIGSDVPWDCGKDKKTELGQQRDGDRGFYWTWHLGIVQMILEMQWSPMQIAKLWRLSCDMQSHPDRLPKSDAIDCSRDFFLKGCTRLQCDVSVYERGQTGSPI